MFCALINSFVWYFLAFVMSIAHMTSNTLGTDDRFPNSLETRGTVSVQTNVHSTDSQLMKVLFLRMMIKLLFPGPSSLALIWLYSLGRLAPPFSSEHQLSFKGLSKIFEGLHLFLPAGQRYWHINPFSNYANKLWPCVLKIKLSKCVQSNRSISQSRHVIRFNTKINYEAMGQVQQMSCWLQSRCICFSTYRCCRLSRWFHSHCSGSGWH